MDTALVIFLMLCMQGMYWLTYFKPRIGLERQLKHAGIEFTLNLIGSLFFLIFVQSVILTKYDIVNLVTVSCMLLMVSGFVLHHFSIILQSKGADSRRINRLHHSISHSLFFIPYSINAVIFCWAALHSESMFSFTDVLVFLFLVYSLCLCLVGFLVGLQKIRLPY